MGAEVKQTGSAQEHKDFT